MTRTEAAAALLANNPAEAAARALVEIEAHLGHGNVSDVVMHADAAALIEEERARIADGSLAEYLKVRRAGSAVRLSRAVRCAVYVFVALTEDYPEEWAAHCAIMRGHLKGRVHNAAIGAARYLAEGTDYEGAILRAAERDDSRWG